MCLTFSSVDPFMICVLCVFKKAQCKELSKADAMFLKADIIVYLFYNYACAYAVIDIHMFVRIGIGPYTATDNITYFRSLPARQKKGFHILV